MACPSSSHDCRNHRGESEGQPGSARTCWLWYDLIHTVVELAARHFVGVAPSRARKPYSPVCRLYGPCSGHRTLQALALAGRCRQSAIDMNSALASC